MNYGPQSQDGFRPERPRLEGASRRDPRADSPEAYDDDIDQDVPTDAIDVSVIRGVQQARDRLLPWFRKIVDSIEEAQNPILVTLAQRMGARTQDITTLDHDLDTPPDETINQLLQLAVDDISGGHFVGKKITYVLIVPLSNGKPSLQNFVLEIPRARGTSFTDPQRAQHFPDPAGVISHFMDKDLQLTQLAVEGANRGVEILERDIDRKTEEIRQLKEENRRIRASQFDRDREMQMLVDGNMKRQFMVDEHRAKVDRDAKIGEGFKAILPQLLPYLLPGQMAQALAVPLALANAHTGGNGGGTQDEGPLSVARDDVSGAAVHGAPPLADLPMVPGVANDTAIIDELIREFEDDQAFFVKLFTVMGERPRCAQLLAMLYESSRLRQQARARQQAEESRRTDSK